MGERGAPKFPGIYVAIVTPMTAAGDPDYGRLREHAQWLLAEGVDGLVVSGTCGEYASLDSDERERVVETVLAAAGTHPVMVGVAAPATRAVVHWATHAKAHGARALMALPPLLYRPTLEEVEAHFAAIDAVGLPIIAYNNPHDTPVDLTPELFASLTHLKNLVAVKEFSGDVRRISALIEQTELEVLGGADDLVLESLLMGATGWIAGLTNVVPRESVHLYHLARAGRLEAARDLYRALLPLLRYDSTPLLVQAIKFGLAARGHAMGGTRPPRLPLAPVHQTAIRAALAALPAE
ncbi:MAG: dihydrodipicolinate synthase family protein [Thermaerobacter sp.]|nr:dihydrodipicolinate synthase family protein [Thermaerobacter sp.]